MYPQVFGKYVLERELARGGMARVLLATLRGADGFEKKLVVKQIRDELAIDEAFVKRFVDEAKTTVALSHPNIVPVYELGVEQGIYFLAMELVEGASVAEVLDAGGKLTPEEGAYLGVEICRGLEYAHRRMQVVHRDITPRNVMIDEEGQVKLIDFGIAARAKTTAAAARQVFGSPGHMPPEQMAGAEVGPRADLFAVAVLLVEAWSGEAPFRRASLEACEAAMRAAHPKPSDSDARLAPLDDVIGRAMALEPGERPADAEELGRALRRYLQDARVDAGDVARALAARAQAARERTRRREPAPPSSRALPDEREAPENTATFAARDEIVAATRRVPSDRPPPVETIATRPIETPARASSPADARGQRPPFWKAFAAVAALGVVAFGARAALRGSAVEKAPATATTTAISTATTTSTSTPTPTSTSTSTSTSTPTPTPTPTSTSTSTSTPTPASTSTPASAAETRRAALALFGEPGTRVAVDGVDRGPCPTSVAVEPGAHEVRFVFVPTGESRGQRVEVAASERVRVRADFTSAAPTVRVER